jgi:hypothetical protein
MENIRFGTVAAMALNAARGDKKAKVWEWRDFFADPRPRRLQSAEEVCGAFESFYALVKAQRETKGE